MNEASNFTLEDYVRILNQYQELQQENTHLKEVIKRCYTPEEIDFEIMPVKAELQAEKDINNNLHKTIDKLRVNLYETQQENHQLKEKLNIYENPEDLTLMFMYCEEKTKDKIKELKDRIEKALQIIDDSGIEIYGRNLDLLISTLKGEENDN